MIISARFNSMLALVLAMRHIYVQAAPQGSSSGSIATGLAKRGNPGSEPGTPTTEGVGGIPFNWFEEKDLFKDVDDTSPLISVPPADPAPINLPNNPAPPVLPPIPAPPVPVVAPEAPVPPALPLAPVAPGAPTAPVPLVVPPNPGNNDKKRKATGDGKNQEEAKRTKKSSNPTCNPLWEKQCQACGCRLEKNGLYSIESCSIDSPFFMPLIKNFSDLVSPTVANYHCANPEYGSCKCNGQPVELKSRPPRYTLALDKINAASLQL